RCARGRARKASRDGTHPRPQRGTMTAQAPIRLGLRENAAQFSLLMVVNAFVGAMVGMERSILPAIAESEFHLAARAAVLSFIVVFGITKAVTNYLAGRLSDRFGRKQVLVAGWLAASYACGTRARRPRSSRRSRSARSAVPARCSARRRSATGTSPA